MVHEFGNLDLQPCKFPKTLGFLKLYPFVTKPPTPPPPPEANPLPVTCTLCCKAMKTFSWPCAYESESVFKGKGWAQHTKDKKPPLGDVVVFSTMPKRHMSTNTTFWMTNLGPCSMVVGKAPFALTHSLWNGVWSLVPCPPGSLWGIYEFPTPTKLKWKQKGTKPGVGAHGLVVYYNGPALQRGKWDMISLLALVFLSTTTGAKVDFWGWSIPNIYLYLYLLRARAEEVIPNILHNIL